MAQTKNRTNQVKNIKGLSSDTKPIYGRNYDGSTFLELDTGNSYIYSAAEQRWILQDQTSEEREAQAATKGVRTIYKDQDYVDPEGIKTKYIIEYTNGSKEEFFVERGPKGEDGKDMDKVVLRYHPNGKTPEWADKQVVQWKHESLPDIDDNWTDLFPIGDITEGFSPYINDLGHWVIKDNASIIDSGVSAYPHVLELRKTDERIEYQVRDYDNKKVIVPWTPIVPLTEITGPRGYGISSVTKTSTLGLVDTYTITFENGETTTFEVTNGEQGIQGPIGPKGETGKGIYSIDVDSKDGLVTRYRILYTDNTKTYFEVKDGEKGAKGDIGEIGPKTIFRQYGGYIQYRAENATEWTDLVPLSDLKGDRGDRGYDGENGLDGRSIVSITRDQDQSHDLIDVYTITYDRGEKDTFTVKNGADGNTITGIDWSQDKSKLIFSFTDGEDIEVDFSELANKVINVDDGEVGQYLVIGLDSQNKKKITFENGYTEGNGINITNKTISTDLDYLNLNMTYTGKGKTGAAVGGLPEGTTINDITIKELLDEILYPYKKPQGISVSGSAIGQTVEIGTSMGSVSSVNINITKGTEDISRVVLEYSLNGSTNWTTLKEITENIPLSMTINMTINLDTPINLTKLNNVGYADYFRATCYDTKNGYKTSSNVRNSFIKYDYYIVQNASEEIDVNNLIRVEKDKAGNITIGSGQCIYYLTMNSGNLKIYDAFARDYLEVALDPDHYVKTTKNITLHSGLENVTYNVHKYTPADGAIGIDLKV